MPNSNIRLIIEKNIPYVAGLLDPYATVRYLAPEEITAKACRDCDGLVIRTRTRCNAELLAKSDVKLIATATIGTDHIDADYCASRSITVVNAPGCNAPAVAQYVFATILELINRPLTRYTLGIVGVGHVGSIVERWAKAFGMRVLLCDPPRQEAEGGEGWVDLDTIAREADIITFHTPLTRQGLHATYHLASADFFSRLQRRPVVINSSRGEVVDTSALLGALRGGIVREAVVDTWENEPNISRELLDRAFLATPHIAGYSADGKANGTRMSLEAVARFFGVDCLFDVEAPAVPPTFRYYPEAPDDAAANPSLALYDPRRDSDALKADPAAFERLRGNYPLRREHF